MPQCIIRDFSEHTGIWCEILIVYFREFKSTLDLFQRIAWLNLKNTILTLFYFVSWKKLKFEPKLIFVHAANIMKFLSAAWLLRHFYCRANWYVFGAGWKAQCESCSLQTHQQKPLFCYSASDYSNLGQTLNPRTLIFIFKFQVLAGMYPVAQVREPYSVVQYLAERSDLPASLGIRLSEDEDAWSAYLIWDG